MSKDQTLIIAIVGKTLIKGEKKVTAIKVYEIQYSQIKHGEYEMTMVSELQE